MSVTAWRIFKRRHAGIAFTGEGARAYGGRWNNPGVPVVYVAGSQSLAALEILVHLSSSEIMAAYRICSVTFETEIIEAFDRTTLPVDWRSDPPPTELRNLGDEWAGQNRSAVLSVPSALVPDEFNYLLNPAHPRFGEIVVGPFLPFQFDARLIK